MRRKRKPLQQIWQEKVLSRLRDSFVTESGKVIEGNYDPGDYAPIIFDERSKRFLPVYKKKVHNRPAPERERVSEVRARREIGPRYAYHVADLAPDAYVRRLNLDSFEFDGVLRMDVSPNDNSVVDTALIWNNYGFFALISMEPEYYYSIQKVNLNVMNKAGSVRTPPGGPRYSTPYPGAIVDSANGYGYWPISDLITAYEYVWLMKVKLQDLSIVDVLSVYFPYPTNYNWNIKKGSMNELRTHAYFIKESSQWTVSHEIVKIQLSPLALVDTYQFPYGPFNVRVYSLTYFEGYIYAVVERPWPIEPPNLLVKINASTWVIAGELAIEDISNYAVLDRTTKRLYLPGGSNPAKVVKVNLNNFTKEAVLSFPGVLSLGIGMIDGAKDYLYFHGNSDYPEPKIYKVRLSAFAVEAAVNGLYGEYTNVIFGDTPSRPSP